MILDPGFYTYFKQRPGAIRGETGNFHPRLSITVKDLRFYPLTS